MTAVHFWICLILLWIVADTNGKTPGSGQIDQPDQGYKGSTSLFTEMISSGNASLHIQKRGPQDKGKYRCLVTSSRETTEHFIIVKVEAPIQSVSLETTHLSGFEEVSCSCRDVYPPPCVNLFIEPAGLPDSLHPFTRKTADKQGLFLVESKLKKLNNLTYSTSASSNHSTGLRHGGHHCRRKSTLEPTYTCILSPHQIKHEVHTRVNITQTKHEDYTTVNITLKPEKQKAESAPQWWIPATVITGIAVAAFIGIIKSGCTKSSKTHVEATEMQPIRVTVANSGAASKDTCLTEEIANRPI